MDEKYIQDLYNQLGGQSKFGKFDDFKYLISTDAKYRQDFHNSFGEKQLGKYDDFDVLVKKKDGGNGSQTTSTTLPPSISTSNQTKYNFELAEDGTYVDVGGNKINIKNGVGTPEEKIIPVSDSNNLKGIGKRAGGESLNFGMPSIRELAKQHTAKSDATLFGSTDVGNSIESVDVAVNGKERIKSKEKKIQEAVTNTAKKYLLQKGIANPTPAQLNEQIQVGNEALKRGDVSWVRGKDGQLGLKNNLGFIDSIVKSRNEALKSSEDAAKFVNEWTPEQKVEYLKIQQAVGIDYSEKETPFIGENQNVAGQFLGENAPFIEKAVGGAALGGLLIAAAPGTMGASLAGLPTALAFLYTSPDAINGGAMAEQVRRFEILKREHTEIDEVELMRQAEQGKWLGGTEGLLTNTILTGTALKLPKALEGKSVFGKYLTGIAKSGLHMGGTIGGLKTATELAGNLEGIETSLSDAVKHGVDAAIHGATTGALLHTIMSVRELPKILKSGIKHDLVTKSKPEEIAEILKMNEDAGTIPPGSTESVLNDLGNFKMTLEKLPSGLSEETQASVAGLIQHRDSILKEAETKDKSVQHIYKEKADAVDRQIAEILRTEKPLEHEIDEATGEPYKQPTFDNIAKKRVADLADKISKGKKIEDAEDLQLQANFPNELETQLNRIAKEETGKNKGKENPNTEILDNVNKYLKDKSEDTKLSQPIEGLDEQGIPMPSAQENKTSTETVSEPIVSKKNVEIEKEFENIDVAIEAAKLDEKGEFEGRTIDDLLEDRKLLKDDPARYFASQMDRMFDYVKDENVKGEDRRHVEQLYNEYEKIFNSVRGITPEKLNEASKDLFDKPYSELNFTERNEAHSEADARIDLLEPTSQQTGEPIVSVENKVEIVEKRRQDELNTLKKEPNKWKIGDKIYNEFHKNTFTVIGIKEDGINTEFKIQRKEEHGSLTTTSMHISQAYTEDTSSINAKYDAEISALKNKPAPTSQQTGEPIGSVGDKTELGSVEGTAKALKEFHDLAAKDDLTNTEREKRDAYYDIAVKNKVANAKELSEAYHADKAAGKETELTKAIESLLGKEQTGNSVEVGKENFKLDNQDTFYHASNKKRQGRLNISTATQFGEGIYFSTDKNTVQNEFGEHVTESKLALDNPVYTNTKEWSKVEELAIENAIKDFNEKKGLTENDNDFKTDWDIYEIPSKFISNAAKELGYDAIIDKGSGNYKNEILVLDESRIIYPEDKKLSTQSTSQQTGNSVEVNPETKTETGEVNQSTKTGNESTKPSIITPSEVKKIQDKEIIVPEKDNGKEPPIEPPKEGEGSNEGEGGVGIKITHEATEGMRVENKLPQYEKNPQTTEAWNIEADKRIKNGEMPALLKRMQENPTEPISEVEQTMMGKHIAFLDGEVAKNPTNENLRAYKNAIELSDRAGGSAWGRSGRARQQTFMADETLGQAFVKEMESLGVDELPETTKQEIKKEFEEITKLRDELAKANEENIRLQTEANAKVEAAKAAKNKPKGEKKTHDDFVKDREKYRNELKEAKEKHDKWLRDNGIQKMGGGTLTLDMAKAIGKIIKSHAEETVLKFEDLVNKVYEEVKDVLGSGVSKNDIVDVIAGVYNEKRPTMSEAAAQLKDYRTEAVLLKKLEDERLGKEPKVQNERLAKSRRIKELQDKIKEVQKRNKDNEEDIEKTDDERLSAKRKSIMKKIEEIEADVKAGIFGREERPNPVILDKKTQALEDRLIELEAQQAIRRAKHDYDKLSKWTKAADTFWQVLGLRRLVNSAIDFSIMFRQAAPVTFNPFKYIPYKDKESGVWRKNSAVKAWANMFNLAFSPEKFKRFQYHLEKSELGRMYTHFGGVFSNPSEVKMVNREEEFSNNLLSRLHQKIESSDNKSLKKASDVANRVWFSERAAASALNTIRIEEFTKGVKDLQRKGITMENSPKDYKDLAKWTLDITGRGNMLKALEDSHAGRMMANRTYFGARLMAAKINMLNPATYIKMSPKVRTRALKDMAGATSGMVLLGMAGLSAGGTISFNPDDPDFMQLRFGDKVYDLTGGSVAYVRTFLRVVKGAVKQIQNPGGRAANSYSRFAASSVWKSMVANKLSPNTAYAYHALTGKSADYDEQGRLKNFDPMEIFEIYPLYVDGTVEAFKKGGLTEALTILLPDIFGIGTQQYEKKGDSKKGGGGGATKVLPIKPQKPLKPLRVQSN